MIDGYLSISSYTTFRQSFLQAFINPVSSDLSFYSIIDGYLSISNCTTSRLLFIQALINPVYPLSSNYSELI